MSNILLLGAGFSNTWGGWLSSEVQPYLLGCPAVAADPALKAIVQRHNNFEEALARVQGQYRHTQSAQDRARLDAFQGALAEMFADMDKAYRDTPFEFQNDKEFLVRTFLIRFNAIFTLNQDTLLERHYFNQNVQLGSEGKWYGWQLPGVHPIHDPSRGPFDPRPTMYTPLAPSEFAVRKGDQPCYKLHGSSNWTTDEGGSLLVMGANKATTLAGHPVLKWYFDKFQEYLSQPVRVMTIGYGFRDEHINRALIDAAKQKKLQLFVVDPLGDKAIAQGNRSRGGAIYAREEIEEELEPVLIGYSSRLLRGTFDRDRAEHAKILRFFKK
jgi:hypothetical protein